MRKMYQISKTDLTELTDYLTNYMNMWTGKNRELTTRERNHLRRVYILRRKILKKLYPKLDN